MIEIQTRFLHCHPDAAEKDSPAVSGLLMLRTDEIRRKAPAAW